MTKQMRGGVLLLSGALLLAATGAVGAQNREKVYRNLTSAQLEAILNDMSIKYNRMQPKNLPNDYDYDFERNNFKVRLTMSNNTRLWISAYFPKATPDTINQWNTKAKFSRAVLDRVNDREYAIVESQLDIFGGATEGMIKQFIKRFDQEISLFDQFVRNN